MFIFSITDDDYQQLKVAPVATVASIKYERACYSYKCAPVGACSYDDVRTQECEYRRRDPFALSVGAGHC